MRDVAARLMGRDRLGLDFFARGQSEDLTRIRTVSYSATLLDLMQAYARICTRRVPPLRDGPRQGLHHGTGAGTDATASNTYELEQARIA